jgi:hypothetical protein
MKEDSLHSCSSPPMSTGNNRSLPSSPSSQRRRPQLAQLFNQINPDSRFSSVHHLGQRERLLFFLSEALTFDTQDDGETLSFDQQDNVAAGGDVGTCAMIGEDDNVNGHADNHEAEHGACRQ